MFDPARQDEFCSHSDSNGPPHIVEKKKPVVTITLSDLQRTGTSMGVQKTLLLPGDLTQLEGAIFYLSLLE